VEGTWTFYVWVGNDEGEDGIITLEHADTERRSVNSLDGVSKVLVGHACECRVYPCDAACVVILFPHGNVHPVVSAQEVRYNAVLAFNVLQLWVELSHFDLQPVEGLGVSGR
jgi:hypothetical protein